jgi:PAS domain-containing protein
MQTCGREASTLAAVLLESLPDPVIGCHTGDTIVSWTRAAEDVYGYAAAEALGRRAATLLHDRQTSRGPAHVPGPTPQLLSWDSPLADADVPGLGPDAPGRIDRQADRVSGAA